MGASSSFRQAGGLESMARAQLEELQRLRLRRLLVRLKERVAFYSACLADVDQDKVELSGLSGLPFTTKKDLRDAYPLGLLGCAPGEVVRYHASSGTRGKPTLVPYTASDLELWAGVSARSLACCGVMPGDLVHNAYGYGLFTGGIGIHHGAEHLGAAVVPASGGRTAQQLTLLQDLRARVLCSTPSYALNLASALEESGAAPESLGLEIGIFGAEPWTEPLRRELERRLGLKAFDIYGASELIGPGVSVECAERAGLHIWEDQFLPEIVHPSTLDSLPDGEEGELVVTTLNKEALPLLRYRTGDLATLTREPCRCGRTMARMTRVRARLDDMLIVRGVNVYPSEIENILLGVDELAPHYQLVLRREKALDDLSVQVEMTGEILARWGSVEDHSVRLRELSDRIRRLLKDNLGLTVSVELLSAGSLARSEGKAVRVVDARGG